jgi:hypothetical protein
MDSTDGIVAGIVAGIGDKVNLSSASDRSHLQPLLPLGQHVHEDSSNSSNSRGSRFPSEVSPTSSPEGTTVPIVRADTDNFVPPLGEEEDEGNGNLKGFAETAKKRRRLECAEEAAPPQHPPDQEAKKPTAVQFTATAAQTTATKKVLPASPVLGEVANAIITLRRESDAQMSVSCDCDHGRGRHVKKEGEEVQDYEPCKGGHDCEERLTRTLKSKSSPSVKNREVCAIALAASSGCAVSTEPPSSALSSSQCHLNDFILVTVGAEVPL